MPTLTFEQINAVLPVLNAMSAEKGFRDPLTKVRIARIRSALRKAFEPISEAASDLVEQYGTALPVRCPDCRSEVLTGEGKRVLPGLPGWREYKAAERDLLRDAGKVEVSETLHFSELVVVRREADGKNKREEPYDLSAEEIEALGDLLVLDLPNAE